ncbi:MAG: molybdopterin-guanine dinucleotide biosynthesis protein B [Pseudomonadota bacterium]
MKVVGVVGWKNSGKTGLVERLVAHFADQGARVATLKHAHHGFDVDQPGTDSFRHRAAGAAKVVVVSSHRVATLEELRGAEQPSLETLLAQLGPVDVAIVEGWKSAPHPKIETVLSGAREPPIAQSDPTISAVASDTMPNVSCPVLAIDATAAIVDFIEREIWR